MWEWQLAGSEVVEVRQHADRLTLRLSAVTARVMEVQPGEAPPEWGYALGVLLDLHHPQVQHCDDHALGRIAEGRLTQEGLPLLHIPLPVVRMQAAGLQLQFANGAVLRATARAWQCRFVAEPRFRESYAC